LVVEEVAKKSSKPTRKKWGRNHQFEKEQEEAQKNNENSQQASDEEH
jgi:hypothetical protein